VMGDRLSCFSLVDGLISLGNHLLLARIMFRFMQCNEQ
jgi:hypothetical protein